VFVLFVSFVAIEHAYKQLVSAIITGTMGNGKRLPTEAQLVDKLRVARRGNCAREPGASLARLPLAARTERNDHGAFGLLPTQSRGGDEQSWPNRSFGQRCFAKWNAEHASTALGTGR
jgi:Bacterial regulatory proteins, gntR family